MEALARLPNYKLSDILAWPVPNYINPVSRRPAIFLSGITTTAATMLVVGLRLFTRSRFTVSKLETNDYLIVVALLMAIAVLVVNIVAVEHGWGRHVWDVSLSWLEILQQSVMATEALFVFAIGFTKLSILAFYLKVFSGYATFKWLARCGLGYVVAWMLACFLAVIFQCWPVSGFWDPKKTNVKCYNMYAGIMASSVLNCLSDIYLFLIPIKWVWKLKIPRRQRAALIAAFGLGLIVCAIGFLRLYYVKLTMHDSYDVSWNGAMLSIISIIEIDLGIICASLPSLKPLVQKYIASKKDRYTARYRNRFKKRQGRQTSLDSEHYGLIRSSFGNDEVFELAMNLEHRQDFELRVSEYNFRQGHLDGGVGIAL